jgi:hypothetical protein
MTKYIVAALILAGAGLGMAVGVIVANWQFRDPHVLLAARVLLGGFGALLAGIAVKSFILSPNPES